MNQNPFIYQSKLSPHGFSIGFQTYRKSSPEPLWYTVSGFKDLSKVNTEAVELSTREEAEYLVRNSVLDFIKRYRTDQANLIMGW